MVYTRKTLKTGTAFLTVHYHSAEWLNDILPIVRINVIG